MRAKTFSSLPKVPAFLGGWILTLSLVILTSAAEPTARMVFNDDAQVLKEVPTEGAAAFVRSWLDREAAAIPFSTFVFLAATPDICTYDSQAGETYGDRFNAAFSQQWAPGIRALRAEGTDALKVVTEHMHAKGKEVLAAIRMNDTHHLHLGHTHPLCPQFAIDHPEFVIQQPDGRQNETALDYSHPEVRQHRLDIMREIVENYDVDGLELNFVRWAKHFPRHQGREKAPIMTSFMEQIHNLLAQTAKQRGRDRMTLGVRVPESLATCWLAGIDIESWVKNGWIDYVVVSTWNNTDPQLPIDEFTRFTKPAGVATIVPMGNLIGTVYAGPPAILDRPIAMASWHEPRSYLGMLINESEARGAAANYYAWGADSISFWNVGIHFGGRVTAKPEQRARMARWTQAVQTPATVMAGPRTYRFLPLGKGMSSRRPPVRNYPWYDEGRSPLGHVNSPILVFDRTSTKQRAAFPFRMADGRQGERLDGLLTFWIYRLEARDKLTVDINGTRLPAASVRRFPIGQRRSGLPGQRFEISLSACPAFRGKNELGLTLESKILSERQAYMEELEIVVNGESGSMSTPKKASRKILLAVDSEGPTGVAEYWARNLTPDNPAFQRYRGLMTDDVNAAIKGCFAGGATEVFVKDDGFRDENLIIEQLDTRAQLLPGGTQLLEGLDETFSGVMLIGLHAMEGAEDAVLAHTWSSSRRRRYWFNGKEGGEVAAYAIVAGHDHQVPIIMATGCTGLAREVHELLGESVVTVAVKEKHTDGRIELFPAERTTREITAGAQRAMRRLHLYQPLLSKFPLHVRLQLQDPPTTTGYLKWRLENKADWPGRQTGDNQLEATLKTTKHIIF